jgi:hypothetical protein
VSDPASALAEALDHFDPIDLASLGSAALLDRVDRKFAVPVSQLPTLVEPLHAEYRSLTVNDRRVSTYATHYFDTPDLAHYRRHQSGHVPRLKVRMRDYVDSGQRFFEVKRRVNSGRTVKLRIPVGTAQADPAQWLADPAFLDVEAAAHSSALQPTVLVHYSRGTLVHRTLDERVTIDVGVTYTSNDWTAALGTLAIIEIKQRLIGPSVAIDAVRRIGARPLRISKFGMAVACVYPAAPRHRFLPLLKSLAPTIVPRAASHSSLAELLNTR